MQLLPDRGERLHEVAAAATLLHHPRKVLGVDAHGQCRFAIQPGLEPVVGIPQDVHQTDGRGERVRLTDPSRPAA
ncbi:hypothetical protein BJF84_06950 [Rhodococcus sp. CUA-806]|nr:hypothetical protein BJF84_06950 [Rhodococcus sp. CUA-806]